MWNSPTKEIVTSETTMCSQDVVESSTTICYLKHIQLSKGNTKILRITVK